MHFPFLIIVLSQKFKFSHVLFLIIFRLPIIKSIPFFNKLRQHFFFFTSKNDSFIQGNHLIHFNFIKHADAPSLYLTLYGKNRSNWSFLPNLDIALSPLLALVVKLWSWHHTHSRWWLQILWRLVQIWWWFHPR